MENWNQRMFLHAEESNKEDTLLWWLCCLVLPYDQAAQSRPQSISTWCPVAFYRSSRLHQFQSSIPYIILMLFYFIFADCIGFLSIFVNIKKVVNRVYFKTSFDFIIYDIFHIIPNTVLLITGCLHFTDSKIIHRYRLN